MRDALGAPSYFIRMMEDISERKRAEEAIAIERALLRTVVDSIPERIYAKDRRGPVPASKRRERQGPWRRGSRGAAGKNGLRHLSAGDRKTHGSRRPARSWNPGSPCSTGSACSSVPAGDQRWIASSKIPLPDASGNIIGIVGFNRDITDRKKDRAAARAARALRRARRDCRTAPRSASKLREALAQART